MIFSSRVLLNYVHTFGPPKLKFHAGDEKSHFGKFLEIAWMTVPLRFFFQGAYELLENNFGYRILTFLPAQFLSKSSPGLTVSTYVLLIELVSK